MTTTQLENGPAPADRPIRRLERPREDRVFRGVCSGFGRYTGTDPVLWRVLIAAMTVLGGAGVLIYLAGWLFIPEEGAAGSIADDRGVSKRLRRRSGFGRMVVLVVVAVMAASALMHNGSLLVLAVVAGAIGYVVSQRRKGEPIPEWLDWMAARDAPATEQPASTVSPSHDDSAAPPNAWTSTAPGAEPLRRSRLGRVTLSVAALTSAVLLALRASGVDGLTAERVLAIDVGIVGIGLVVGTWWGRSRGLIAAGLALLAATGLAAVGSDSIAGGMGDRHWVVDGVDSTRTFRLAAGEATLDLRSLPNGRSVDVTVKMGAGHLAVLLPEQARVRVDARVDAGQITGLGADVDGWDVERTADLGPASATTSTLRLRLRAGQVEVLRDQA
jgi:phage shock protein PspC (stress-responsive transcriptional regulator)